MPLGRHFLRKCALQTEHLQLVQDHSGTIRTCSRFPQVLSRLFYRARSNLPKRASAQTLVDSVRVSILLRLHQRLASVVYLDESEALISTVQRLLLWERVSKQGDASQRCCDGESSQAFMDRHDLKSGTMLGCHEMSFSLSSRTSASSSHPMDSTP